MSSIKDKSANQENLEKCKYSSDFTLEKCYITWCFTLEKCKLLKFCNALSNVMAYEDYDVPQAYVFCQENVQTKGKITYYPIYMITFFEQIQSEEKVYRFDLTWIGDNHTKE